MNINNINNKSSKMVANFLKKNNLHKKDFAQMIGVTLSYVYNLIDDNVPFSTRSITLERIAVVMDINPEDFVEYQIPSEQVAYSENLIMLKDFIKSNNLSTLDFLKAFERKKRLELVDILRGVKPLYIDFIELKKVADTLTLENDEFFLLWKNRITEYLAQGGFDVEKNKDLLNKIFDYIYKDIILKN